MSMQTRIITHEKLLSLLDAVRASGKQLYAPQRLGTNTYFRPVSDVKSIVFDYIQTTESPKAVLFPKVERMLSFELKEKNIQMTDPVANNTQAECVLFGSRPCDAVGLKTLADFFRKDISDAFVQQRQDKLTVISVSCTKGDEHCFCTSVGLSPGDTTGSDILLTPIENNTYYVEAVTEKGTTFLAQNETWFNTCEPKEKKSYLTKVKQSFTAAEITKRLSKAFDHPIWKDASLRCIGCGTCAFVCPVCSCFDIQDEGTNKKGERLRCWDSCGFGLFTLHTSGHNPRSNQTARWRQRVMHKFSYMADQYEMLGCVGCGRCSRACPVDMSIKEQLEDIVKEIPV